MMPRRAILAGVLMVTSPLFAASYMEHPRPPASARNDAATLHVAHSREPVKPELLPPTKMRPPREIRKTLPIKHFRHAIASEQQTGVCDESGLLTKSGASLVAHIRAVPFDCVSRLFGDAPENVRFAAFQRQNMIDVAQAAAALARTYDGTETSRIVQLYYFLRAGYFVNFYNREQFTWTDQTPAVANAMILALDAFVANAHFYDDTEQHAVTLSEVLITMDSAEQQARYLPVVKNWLRRWTPHHARIHHFRLAVNSLFVLIFRCHNRNACVQVLASDAELMNILRDFALMDWMLGTDAEILIANAARELARFLYVEDALARAAVRQGVRAILNRYSLTDGAAIWIAAAITAEEADDCAFYGICGFAEDLEVQILSNTYSCDHRMFRTQTLTQEKMQAACDTLAHLEIQFHHLLETGEKPVADDHNTRLEIVVFGDSDEYATYSYLFFGNNTDNGGIYLEGDPSNPDSQARFIAYVATWLPDRPVWNLEHEYIHYLDGRFNLHGGFGAYRVDTHKTVWWAEGLAEYASLGDANEYAVALALDDSRPALPLHEAFATTYSDGQDRIYRWGYLAVRFMFETAREAITELLDLTRVGDYDGYLAYINTLATPEREAAWVDWLASLGEGEGPGWLRGWRLAVLLDNQRAPESRHSPEPANQ